MSRKLLVIDDDGAICDFAGRLAQEADFEVVAVTDPRQAAAQFLTFRPDLVLLDLIMPGVDGISVLDAILTSGIPAAIMLTVGADAGEGYVRIAAGVTRYHGLAPLPVLHKPFHREELLRVFRQIDDPIDPAATAAV
ncbi:MAG TPA: response regulator [Acetobacteraceae bacterium]|nr:response regulator [Acetobacteraceae bacterium]